MQIFSAQALAPDQNMCETFSMSGETKQVKSSTSTIKRLLYVAAVCGITGGALAQVVNKPVVHVHPAAAVKMSKMDIEGLDAKTEAEIDRTVSEAMKQVDAAMKEVNFDMSGQHIHVPPINVHVPAIHIRIPAIARSSGMGRTWTSQRSE